MTNWKTSQRQLQRPSANGRRCWKTSRCVQASLRFFARQPALSRLVLREMVFYESGAQAGRFQATREGLIDLLGKVVALAVAQKNASPNDTPQFVGWTIFCIFQVELRRWLSHDAPNLREGMAALQRALTLFIGGVNPSKNALVLTRHADIKLDKAPELKTSTKGRILLIRQMSALGH
jgi:hypothetical protein